MAFTQEGLVCLVCRGFVFREAENGDLVCTQCGTVSEQSHKATIEEDFTAIQKDRFGVSVRRVLPGQKKRKRKEKKDKVLSLQHILFIVQKILVKQVNSVKPFIPCPEEYDSLCKNLWLRLILKTKPYLSNFTHIYPYTMMRIKAQDLSTVGTPASGKSTAPITPPYEPSQPETPRTPGTPGTPGTPRSPKTINNTQFAESLRKSLLESVPSSPKQPEPSSLMFSGMELPSSLFSFLSQSQPDLVKKRTGMSPKRAPHSPKRRKNSLTSAVVEPKKVIEWDDDELVLYGQEKVFSFSGYQLQMGSLLAILYAAARILQLPLLARDFELAAMDGLIPFINITQFMEEEDAKYIKPIKHWFSKVVIPNAMRIESDAWAICNEIGICFAAFPLLPIIDRVGSDLQFPAERTWLVKAVLQTDRRVLASEASDSPVLLWKELTEVEWNQRKVEFENASLSRMCEQSVVYCAALFVLSTMILHREVFVEELDEQDALSARGGFGLQARVHLPFQTYQMASFTQPEREWIMQKMEGILKGVEQPVLEPNPIQSPVVEKTAQKEYPIFYGLKYYQLDKLSKHQRKLVQYVSYKLEISISILLAHIRSVEYLLRSQEKLIFDKIKEYILESYQ